MTGARSRASGADLAHERTQPVAQDRRRRLEQRTGVAQRLREACDRRLQRVERRAEFVGEAARADQARPHGGERAGQPVEGRPQVLLLAGDRLEGRVGRVHDARDFGVLRGRGLGEDREVADQALELLAPIGQRRGDLLHLLGGRAERAQELVQIAPAALGSARDAVDEQVEVGARVGVERVGELVGVDGRARGADTDDPALGERVGRRTPGTQLDDQVLQRRIGDELRLCVLIDTRKLGGIDLHRDPGAAADDLRARDLPHANPRDVDGLPETRRETAGRRQVGVDRVAVVEGDAQPLVDQDDAARDGREDREARDRGDEHAVVAQDALHRVPSARSSAHRVAASSRSAALKARVETVAEGMPPLVR